VRGAHRSAGAQILTRTFSLARARPRGQRAKVTHTRSGSSQNQWIARPTPPGACGDVPTDPEGLQIGEAFGANIEALGTARGHRTPTVLRKGGQIVTLASFLSVETCLYGT
jgi:hypothetical protein